MTSICISVAVLSTISFICGSLLGYTSYRFAITENIIVNQIDKILPQSQCGQCGYPGCLPYANAIAKQDKIINKCIPGGEYVMLKIAKIINIDPQPLDNSAISKPEHTIAWINEDNCIGCTKCIQVCPVDAIIGAKKTMHTVLSEICTGCNLCLATCPKHCIDMNIASNTLNTSYRDQPNSIVERTILVQNHVTNI
ncbi:electron transport complex subunit RsxB [Candidatus Erwinia haradaeae]|uniref:Ion-translocating oxidoreductase complex subunit B n=1 Tax=Candidatus Erwinia haradaeae TaxID=1922217 RepID=A0A451D2U9_9GAMM|nr:electron transport complex subunit RsxB [Candidatus Erwinia haradaeae]VFP79970.1 Electron transport complex subunit RsxB [Candidatus Erwinia haradaeae]